uniref:Uncharacterized protein n=1 Tax=Arundo donax TaxID=35708 RepID=A0A0A9C379_ARUDO
MLVSKRSTIKKILDILF